MGMPHFRRFRWPRDLWIHLSTYMACVCWRDRQTENERESERKRVCARERELICACLCVCCRRVNAHIHYDTPHHMTRGIPCE